MRILHRAQSFSHLVPLRHICTWKFLMYILCASLFIFFLIQQPFYVSKPSCQCSHDTQAVTVDKPARMRSIFDMMENLGVQLIVLDKDTLSLINGSSELPKLVTFGVFKKSAWKLEVIKSWYNESDWNIVSAHGLDYRLINKKEHRSIYRQTIAHFFFISHYTIIHLAVVYKRNHFYWIPQINATSLPNDYAYLANLTYRIPLPMAVDAFECSPRSLDYCIPHDMDYYLWQLQYASFRECHYEDIVYPFNRHFPGYTDPGDTSAEKEALNELYSVTRKRRVPAMLFCGTLLGWYRQCDYILNTKDMDTAMLAPDFKMDLLKDLFQNEILSVYNRIGTPDLRGVEFRTHSRGNVWLDLFFLYETSDHNLTMHMWNRNWWYYFDYPTRKGLCSAELLDVLVYVPCNYKDFILADYGPDGWFAPYNGSSYANINMFIEHIYNDTDVEYMMHTYENRTCDDPNILWGCDQMPAEVLKSPAYQESLVKKVHAHSLWTRPPTDPPPTTGPPETELKPKIKR